MKLGLIIFGVAIIFSIFVLYITGYNPWPWTHGYQDTGHPRQRPDLYASITLGLLIIILGIFIT
jgi:hypothetical protein